MFPSPNTLTTFAEGRALQARSGASAGPSLAEQGRSCPLCPLASALELLPPDRHPHAPQPRCVTKQSFIALLTWNIPTGAGHSVTI